MKDELLRDLEAGVRLRQSADSSIDAPILAMEDVLELRTDIGPKDHEELLQMSAFAIEHFQGGVRGRDGANWIGIKRRVVDTLPTVPKDLTKLPKRWLTIFLQVNILYQATETKD